MPSKQTFQSIHALAHPYSLACNVVALAWLKQKEQSVHAGLIQVIVRGLACSSSFRSNMSSESWPVCKDADQKAFYGGGKLGSFTNISLSTLGIFKRNSFRGFRSSLCLAPVVSKIHVNRWKSLKQIRSNLSTLFWHFGKCLANCCKMRHNHRHAEVLPHSVWSHYTFTFMCVSVHSKRLLVIKHLNKV